MTLPRRTVVYATNARFWSTTFISMYSLLVNNRESAWDIYVLSDEPLPQLQCDSELLRETHPETSVTQLLVDRERFNDFPTWYDLPIQCYFRLIVASSVPEDVGITLYLDGDTLIRRSLKDLFDTDLQGCIVGAVREAERPQSEPHAQRLGLPSNASYFNSGVLLVDLDKWREQGIEEKAFNYVQENLSVPKKLKRHDQDVLNAVLAGKWKQLDNSYNYCESTVFPGRRLYRKEAMSHQPHIAHFSGSNKPAHGGSLHPYEDEYWTYLLQTPYGSRSGRMRAQLAKGLRYLRMMLVTTVRNVPGGTPFLEKIRPFLEARFPIR